MFDLLFIGRLCFVGIVDNSVARLFAGHHSTTSAVHYKYHSSSYFLQLQPLPTHNTLIQSHLTYT